MAKSAMIRARVEPDLKKKVETLLSQMGLNVTEAINLFYHQIVLQKGLPFDVRLPRQDNPSAIAQETRKALIQKVKAMTPDERLEAFFHHSSLISQWPASGGRPHAD